MAFTPAEESGLRQLLGQSPQLLSLAGNEPAIIQELGAQDVTIQDLQLASSLLPTDKIIGRFGGEDKASLLSVLSAFLKTPQGLALGSAAYKDVGVGAGQIPDMASFSFTTDHLKLPSGHMIVIGSFNSTIPQSPSGTVLSTEVVTFPTPFPLSLMVVAGSFSRGVGNGPLFYTCETYDRRSFTLRAGIQSSASVSVSGTFNYIALGRYV